MTQQSELLFILDRSGSMSGLEEETIEGFNTLLDKQKRQEGSCNVSTVLFNDHMKVLHSHQNIQTITPLTRSDYRVGGSTALLDAIGHAIVHLDLHQQQLSDSSKAKNIMVVITTDGHENASKHFSRQHIKHLIERQKMLYDWEFIFLGANLDAIEAARSLGIHEDKAVQYHADKEGTSLNFEVLSDVILKKRRNQTITRDWKKTIEDDFRKR